MGHPGISRWEYRLQAEGLSNATHRVWDPKTSPTRVNAVLRTGGVDAIDCFKALAEETGIPYQNLINLYLRQCAHAGKKPALSWAS